MPTQTAILRKPITGYVRASARHAPRFSSGLEDVLLFDVLRSTLQIFHHGIAVPDVEIHADLELLPVAAIVH